MNTKMQISLGEFRNTEDEAPISHTFIRQQIAESKAMHAHINYQSVIADLEHKLSMAKPKDKANVQAVLNIARQQMAAGFGK